MNTTMNATIDRASALKTLRIDGSPDETSILAAFTRLARRYPRHQFPDRYDRLLQAKEFLLNPDPGFKDILYETDVKLSWYPKKASLPTEETPTEKKAQLFQHLNAIYRHAVLSVNLKNEESMLSDIIHQMMHHFDLEHLERLLDD